MTIAQHETRIPMLPVMDDEKLKEYWQFQNGRIHAAEKFGFCLNMLPIAKDLKLLAENEMRARGIDYSCFKKLL